MKPPTLLDDVRDVVASWHDVEFRRGFIAGFVSTIPSTLVKTGLGVLIGLTISRMLP